MDPSVKELFVQQISEHKAILHKVCNLYGGSQEEKKDMMQEITLQLWRAYPAFRNQSKFSTWMYRVALNTVITNFRKSKREPVTTPYTSEIEHLPDKEESTISDQKIQRLYRAISMLNEIDRAIILLYLEKKSYVEIGDIMGLKEKNISVKIVRIKKKLKILFETT
jgi:RNA polymerase sigma factor (sigma-70 family)